MSGRRRSKRTLKTPQRLGFETPSPSRSPSQRPRPAKKARPTARPTSPRQRVQKREREVPKRREQRAPQPQQKRVRRAPISARRRQPVQAAARREPLPRETPLTLRRRRQVQALRARQEARAEEEEPEEGPSQPRGRRQRRVPRLRQARSPTPIRGPVRDVVPKRIKTERRYNRSQFLVQNLVTPVRNPKTGKTRLPPAINNKEKIGIKRFNGRITFFQSRPIRGTTRYQWRILPVAFRFGWPKDLPSDALLASNARDARKNRLPSGLTAFQTDRQQTVANRRHILKPQKELSAREVGLLDSAIGRRGAAAKKRFWRRYDVAGVDTGPKFRATNRPSRQQFIPRSRARNPTV